MPGLILPDGVEPSPERVPLPPSACIYARRAVDVLDRQAEADSTMPHEEPSEYAQHLMMLRDDLAVSCGRLCAEGCRVWTSLGTKRLGIELADTEDEQNFVETLVTITDLGNHKQEESPELDQYGQHIKAISKGRIRLLREQHPDEDEVYSYPEVTDGAYGLLASMCGVNYAMMLGVLDRLFKTSMAQQADGVTETSRSYPVLLTDPTKITLKDVQLALASPEHQDLMRLQDTPRSQIFRHAADVD